MNKKLFKQLAESVNEADAMMKDSWLSGPCETYIGLMKFLAGCVMYWRIDQKSFWAEPIEREMDALWYCMSVAERRQARDAGHLLPHTTIMG